MKPLKRFRIGGWVLGYISKGYCDHKHIILFRVEKLTRKTLEASCRHSVVLDYESEQLQFQEIYWKVPRTNEVYFKSSIADIECFHLTEEEAMLILVQDI